MRQEQSVTINCDVAGFGVSVQEGDDHLGATDATNGKMSRPVTGATTHGINGVSGSKMAA